MAAITTDIHLLRRILENLLRNALRYAPVGSTIDIDWRIEEQKVQLSVRDRGPGIPTELKEIIFEPYTQVAPDARFSSGGLGLGLNFCRMAAGALLGSLSVEDLQPGTRFVLTLPQKT